MPLPDVIAAIARAERAAARPPGCARLIAVSKKQPPDRIAAALDAGQRRFGENRVQEAAARWPALRQRFDGVELHLVGPLQTNKTRQALDLFDAIHSLDRPKLARALADAAAARGACPRLLVQVNTGAEPQKAGVFPGDADRFLAQCRAEFGLSVEGLMCIPPAAEPPAPHFDMLAKIAARNGLAELSMGMSGDFEAAIACGATYVRIGTAVFGERPAAEA